MRSTLSLATVLLCCGAFAAEAAIPVCGSGQKPASLHASWYGKAFHLKRDTGCSTARHRMKFNMYDPHTIAHKTLRCGTRLMLHYKGRSLEVRVTDRGPYIPGRDIDLSAAGADRLGTKGAGVAKIQACILR